MNDTGKDLRFAVRQLVNSPGFALTAMVVFALGIAASAAIFAFVDAALVKPLPYFEPFRTGGPLRTNSRGGPIPPFLWRLPRLEAPQSDVKFARCLQTRPFHIEKTLQARKKWLEPE